jgi:FdhD protein
MAGLHAAAIFNREGEFMFFAEDPSRHNAVDKVIGEALLKDENLSDRGLVCTGRFTGDIVMKCARVKIPLLTSVRSPLYSGIYIAEKTGVTVCSIKKGKLLVFTCPERIS